MIYAAVGAVYTALQDFNTRQSPTGCHANHLAYPLEYVEQC